MVIWGFFAFPLAYASPESPKRHCCRVSTADKECWVYPLDPHPDAVALYSGCTPGKRRVWFLPVDRHTASLVGLSGRWRHARMKWFFTLMDPMLLCPGKGLVLPNISIDETATYARFLLLSLPNNAMSQKLPLVIQKALIAIEAQAVLLTSTSPIAAIPESEPVNPILNNVPFTCNISAFPSNSGVQPTSVLRQYRMLNKKQNRARKSKKELLIKMNDAIIEIKMAPHKPRKSTPDQNSSDEDMIDDEITAQFQQQWEALSQDAKKQIPKAQDENHRTFNLRRGQA
ncbi:hypothetical protein TNCV_2960591 [Trichonephila clavipes]|nr:hypothetical protein TNCV_2960591 [Trichonephila clavipes]